MRNRIAGITVCFVILTVIFGGCDSSTKEVVHPIQNRFPPDEIIDHRLDLARDGTGQLPTLYHPDSLRKIGEIGIDSVFADEYYYYNNPPSEIDIDPEGNIYLVQEHTNSINVYEKDGTFKYSIGGDGRGPGEFLEINTFDFDSDYSTLYVLGFYKIEVYKRVDNQFVPHDTIRIENFWRTYDLCVLNDHIFVSGFRVDPSKVDSTKNLSTRQQQVSALNKLPISKPVFRFDIQSSEREFDFGYVYETKSGFEPYNGLLSQTMLTCNEATNTVMGTLHYFPYIFGYDADGRIKWRSTIDNYASIETTEKFEAHGPVLSRYSNEGFYNRYYPGREIDSGKYSLVQIQYVILSTQPENKDNFSIPDSGYRTLLIDTSTGQLFVSDAYQMFGVQKNNLVVTMDVDPDTYTYNFDIHEF